MTTNPNKLNWKIAATVGTIAGVAVGGFAFAAPDNDGQTPDGVVLEDVANSAPRLSAPIVIPTTAAQLASAAPVLPAVPAEVSAPSPAPTTTLPAPAPAPAPVEIDSPVAAVSPALLEPDSPVAAVSPAPLEPDSPASPVSPVSPPSPVSPVSPASPESGVSS